MNHWDNAEIRFRKKQVANFEQSFLNTLLAYIRRVSRVYLHMHADMKPCHQRVLRLIERSVCLDIFPFHLKFTTGRIFRRPIFSHRIRVFSGLSLKMPCEILASVTRSNRFS